ncbi:hypothetical protein BOX15_Mlig004156g2 [Macrostomum lignano]|uniref:BPL/LPL catalytic domain-containing protein n=1 Tax=Macrostomum lignano TaxID=282301 RepID=A0A267GBL2_9PLAT|nr:hypothetical protein BOX15_Mlig004156g2 [Macrostomum lignano]
MPTLAAATRTSPKLLGELKIIQSASRDIFWNLALEDALFRRQKEQSKLSKPDCCLLIYRNKPCVVIGSFQNPWLECGVRDAEQQAVSVARRFSGGGTVYHDLGNWNLSLITPSAWYKREANAEFMRRLCERLAGPGNQVTVGQRFDIFNNSYKVAGSAAKLAQGAAYHHFCLLMSTDLTRLSACLRPSIREQVVTNATSSIRSPVANIVNPSVSSKLLLAAVTDELAHASDFGHPAGAAATISVGALDVCPENVASSVPGVSALSVQESADRLRSWDWVFGRTPKFQCQLPSPCSMTLTIDKGHIADLSDCRLRSFLVGQPFRASVLLPYVDCFRQTGLLDGAVLDQLERFFARLGH